MELRQLEYFYSVSKLKSFTKASEVLCVSQPSITISIKKLEEELGLELLKRSNREISLTEHGKIFYDRIEDLLGNINNIILEMSELKASKKEVINIGIVPMAGEYVYTKVFKHYKDNKNISINAINVGSEQITKLIEEDQLDIGVIILENMSNLLEYRPIKNVETVVCISRDHILKDTDVVSFEMLKEEDFILPVEGTYTRSTILNECEKYKIKPKIIFTSTQIETSRSLVANNIGITFLERHIAEKDSNIICKSFKEPLYKQLGIVWKKNKYLSKNKKELIDFISDL